MSEGKKQPLFSIIVLCYHNTELLEGMLDSILKQDYTNIELIISDDNSPDFDCERIETQIHNKIQELNTRNITRLVVRKNKQNLKTVRHFADVLPMAEGEYIVFTAADDRFASDHVISAYVRLFNEKPDRKWLVGKLAMTTVDYKKTIYVTPNEEDIPFFTANDAKRLFSRWSRRGMAVPCCMGFRKEAFKLAGGIDLEYTFMEDWPFVLRLLLNGYTPIFMDEVVALHSKGGITNSNNRYGVEKRRIFYEDKYRLLDTITEPNLHLLSEEDKRSYYQYRREIMDRNYFLQIDMQTKSKLQLLKQALKNRNQFFWLTEHVYWKIDPRINRKALLILSQCILVISALLFDYAAKGSTMHSVFGLFAWIDFIGAFGCIGVAFGSAALKRIFMKKQEMRRRLVN